MNAEEQIASHIAGLANEKRAEVQELHTLILQWLPATKLWFDDGKNEDGKTVTNPTIGYGSHIIKYADGKTKEFFQIGVSANKSGISVYILGIPDKNYLPQTYKQIIGKATVTGYCIKFNKLKNVNINVLEDAILNGVKITGKS
ncbi:DUF1801 domain-containing protein [Mucilaginibacter conchicola]|uniref:DUF1801 domain-containing protein n=1 Tax=Mucilaginibacter conchicola TaxID=2303333 RepID=A0A372NXY9_9SPHI|nr:DUF1801 domain-containing protein [Mucilaginibacter conchicola]RFZ94976.1 DUF1801 domain-containing protein [Mucilaginibacter conchicola]